MRRLPLTLAATGLLLPMLAGAAAPQPTDFWTTPTITGYGRIHYLPNAAYKPASSQTYRIVFSLTLAPKSPGGVNPSLDHVARTVNLYVAAGVPLDHLKFVAVASGAATPLALNDQQYRAAYGVPNPNLPLIAELRNAGVDVAVCGQAVAEHHFEYSWVDRHVTLSLSALTTITTLEHKGYGLMQM